jgi:hypothetical protein
MKGGGFKVGAGQQNKKLKIYKSCLVKFLSLPSRRTIFMQN